MDSHKISHKKIVPMILTTYYVPPRADTKTPDSFWEFLTNLIRDSSYSIKLFFINASGGWRYHESLEQYGDAKVIVGRLFPTDLKRVNFPLSSVYSIVEAIIRGVLMTIRYRQETLDQTNKLIIHAQTPETGIAAALLSSVTKAGVIVTLHSIFRFSRAPPLARSALRIIFTYLVDLTVCSSHRMKNELMQIGVPDSKIAMVPLWVNYSLFKPIDKRVAKKTLGLKESDFIVLFAGRLIAMKGVEILVQSLPELEKSLPNMKMIIIGGGSLEDLVLRTASTLKCLEYRGLVSADELPLYYNAADVTIAPSMFEEAFGLVILEALACGTPVIGSKRGAIPEVLRGFKEYLIEPTTDELTRKIIELHEKLGAMSTSEIEELRVKLRDYAIEKFGKGAGIYSEIYQSL